MDGGRVSLTALVGKAGVHPASKGGGKMLSSKKSFGSLFAALILAGLLLPGCQAAQAPPPQAEAPVPTNVDDPNFARFIYQDE